VFTGVRTHVAAVDQAIVKGDTKLEGPVVVVTGASRGIGKATALALGKAGCKVRSLSNLLINIEKFIECVCFS
jgi:3-oxoacyl-[acyl-carrier protein] reductase